MLRRFAVATNNFEDRMDRAQFEALRNLPGKKISADIQFTPSRETSPNLTFAKIKVDNSLGWDIELNGTYKPGVPSVTFNFVAIGVGPVCRIDVNGQEHKPAGRTHKHDLRQASDPKGNLPLAVPRLDLVDKSPVEIWRILCTQANINHTGSFLDPSDSNA